MNKKTNPSNKPRGKQIPFGSPDAIIALTERMQDIGVAGFRVEGAALEVTFFPGRRRSQEPAAAPATAIDGQRLTKRTAEGLTENEEADLLWSGNNG